MFAYVPLAVVLMSLCVMAATPFSARLDRFVTRVAYALFDGEDVEGDVRRERVLRAAGIGTPLRVYVTKTQLYAGVSALCGGVVGVYAAAYFLSIVPPDRLPSTDASSLVAALGLDPFRVGLFVALTVGGAVFGTLAAVGTYIVRWQFPSVRAQNRRRQIDASMPRMVAFVYALSRGGMAFTDVMRALAYNRDVFGAGASEVAVGVRNIDVFGEDLVSAVRDVGRRTPSEQFRSFNENLASVLRSGRNLSEFLRGEYDRYRAEAEEQQEEILELLETTAEIYVTVVVAGMLFLVTILLVIGLTTGDTLSLIRFVVYVLIPGVNVVFIVYLSGVTRPLRMRGGAGGEGRGPLLGPGGDVTGGDAGATPSPEAVADGGTAVADAPAGGRESTLNTPGNRARLHAYERVASLRETLAAPVDALVRRPPRVLYVTVPLVLAFVVTQVPAFLADGTVLVRVFDDVLVRAALFLLGTYAVVHEVSRRRLARLESAVPDLLERLASLNEAGVSVVSSLDRVRQSDIGALDDEVGSLWRDIQWGATVEDALQRFERRVGAPAMTRVTTLITNAMRASNEIGPVLRIAAEQARSDHRLRRQRRQRMFTYLVVVYVAFLVFLVVISTMDLALIPNLPQADPATAENIPAFIATSTTDVEAYRLAFFHAALIQSTLSGLVAGQMGGGSIADGIKHATVMLAITYLVLVVVPSPDSTVAIAGFVLPGIL